MAIAEMEYKSKLRVWSCCKCSIVFAITEEFENWRREDGKLFYCPRGHGQYFSDKEDKQAKRKNVPKEEARREALIKIHDAEQAEAREADRKALAAEMDARQARREKPAEVATPEADAAPPADEPDDPCKCPKCGKKYTSRVYLPRHMRKVHGIDKWKGVANAQ